MNNYPSPRTPGSTPIHEWEYSRMSSATPTPSPRPNWLDSQTPRRPATRAHVRGSSYSTQSTFSPRPPRDSPRYNSSGEYATVDDVPPYYNDTVYSRAPSYDMPRPIAQPRAPTSLSHNRRASTSVPQRPATVRPTAAAQASPRVKPPAPPKATEEDAARQKIPPGYSLKNWDPREEPILLLGSVFDANSLGKWIYDWTAYKVGPREPLAEMAGELWLLLLELTEKTNRAINIGLKVRSKERRNLVEDYLDASERLMAMLRLLLKNCEAPMLKASSKKKQAILGKNSGIEFVDTLFGRDRELVRTEKFMQKVRTWSMRFDANVSPILENPTA